MKYFKLPDLGEGLSEAEIVEWHVKVGDTIEVDQLMVSVETAKAIVDVPSPQKGIIGALFGEPGDVIHIAEALVEYQGEAEEAGTVVGDLSLSAKHSGQDDFIVGSAYLDHQHAGGSVQATPSVRALAKRLGVDIAHITSSSQDGRISSEDVQRAASMNEEKGHSEALKGVRKAMAKTMALSHAQVVPVTLHDDANVHAWFGKDDITMRLIHGITYACSQEPSLNTWFDGERLTRRILKQIDLAIAVDTEVGLFVPVLRDIQNRSLDNLRSGLNALRAAVQSRKIPPQEMQNATITLSNFGTLAGKYANPIVVPPMVCIVGAGGIRKQAVVVDGEVAIQAMLPLSVTFDHRAVTGGEAARFLKALMDDLALASV